MMEFEADRMTGLILRDENVLPERDVVLEEYNMRVANSRANSQPCELPLTSRLSISMIPLHIAARSASPSRNRMPSRSMSLRAGQSADVANAEASHAAEIASRCGN